MGILEERRAVEATEVAQRYVDPTLVVFWNDVLRRYVMAQDWRKTPQRDNAYCRIETQGWLVGCTMLKQHFPNGLTPYHAGFLFDYEGRPVEPSLGVMLLGCAALFPYEGEQLNKVEAASDTAVESMRAKHWD